MALKQIKNKIKSVQRTGKVTKAMEAVSAVKMRKSQERALKGRAYGEAALRILLNLSQSTEVQNHHFFKSKGEQECFVVITSDKGLAGSLNSAVLKEANARIRGKDPQTIEIIAFGKKAYEHYLRRGYAIPKHYVNVQDEVRVSDMEEVVTLVSEAFEKGKYRTVHVVYQNFISTFEQKPRARQVLPIKTDEIQKMIHDIIPREGKYADEETAITPAVYTVEEESGELLNSLFRSLVEIMLYHALLESKASEHSARMVAMKNATDKSKDLVKSLTLAFNKARQSVITREVSEITGGIEAMKTA